MLKQQILELEKKLDEKAEEVFDLLNKAMEQKRKIHKLDEPPVDSKTDGNQSMKLEVAKNIVSSTGFNNFR